MSQNYSTYLLVGIMILSIMLLPACSSSSNDNDTDKSNKTTAVSQNSKQVVKSEAPEYTIKTELITSKFLIPSKLKVYSRDNFDLAQILVAKIMIGNEQINVSSLKPAITQSNNSKSVSIIAFDQKREKLIFFTSNKPLKNASEVNIPVSELKSNLSFDFPFVNAASGAIESQTVKLIELKQK